ncbi:ROK family protein [Methanocorpusculum sp.]
MDTTWNLPCGCRGTGHWEAYASGTGIPNFFQAWREERIESEPKSTLNAGQILNIADQGSPLFGSFCDELAKINGRGLSSVIAAYNPDLIVMDGPIVRNYPSLIAGRMTEYIDHYLTIPEIRISVLEGKAPLLGASVSAFQALERRKL